MSFNEIGAVDVLESVLDLHSLELVSLGCWPPIYSVAPRESGMPAPTSGQLDKSLFGPPNTNPAPTNITISTTDATVGQVLTDIAREARMNVSYSNVWVILGLLCIVSIVLGCLEIRLQSRHGRLLTHFGTVLFAQLLIFVIFFVVFLPRFEMGSIVGRGGALTGSSMVLFEHE